MPSTTVYSPTLAPTGYSCLFGRNQVPAATCKWDNTNQKIIIETPSTENFEVCPLAIVITTIPAVGTPANEIGFKVPETLASAGEHKIKMQTFIDAAVTAEEEAEFFYHTKPKPFFDTGDEFKVDMKHKTEGVWNAVTVNFTNKIEIPVNGKIEVEFKTINLGWPHDLGWGMVSL
jgi:hypothetical protein